MRETKYPQVSKVVLGEKHISGIHTKPLKSV